MLRLVKSVEERPEHSTVINWTVPVYIKYGEDYYKVCFDIKRKPLSDGTLPLTEDELREFNMFFHKRNLKEVSYEKNHIRIYYKSEFENHLTSSWVMNVKAILWLADRFDLTSNN